MNAGSARQLKCILFSFTYVRTNSKEMSVKTDCTVIDYECSFITKAILEMLFRCSARYIPENDNVRTYMLWRRYYALSLEPYRRANRKLNNNAEIVHLPCVQRCTSLCTCHLRNCWPAMSLVLHCTVHAPPAVCEQQVLVLLHGIKVEPTC